MKTRTTLANRCLLIDMMIIGQSYCDGIISKRQRTMLLRKSVIKNRMS